MVKTYYVQYWELPRCENIQEDAFPNWEEAKAFYDEIMANDYWDACIVTDADKELLERCW